MTLGSNQSLYILLFDHRGSCWGRHAAPCRAKGWGG